MYDYGARFYDPTVARWWVPDPVADCYWSYSPYHFVANNPIRFIDFVGLQIMLPPVLGTSCPPYLEMHLGTNPFHWHHLIPLAERIANHPVVRAAIRGGFDFSKRGGENTKWVEQYLRSNDKGVHGNAPKWEAEVWNRLNRWMNDAPQKEGFSFEQAAKFCRQLAKELDQKIEDNPGIRINKLFTPPPSQMDNTKRPFPIQKELLPKPSSGHYIESLLNVIVNNGYNKPDETPSETPVVTPVVPPVDPPVTPPVVVAKKY